MTVQAPQVPWAQPTCVPVRPQVVTQTISQRGAWFDLNLDLTAIDIECNFHDRCSGFAGGAGQGTLHQGCEQGAAVSRGAVNVIRRIDNLSCHLGGRSYGVRIDSMAIQHGFRRCETPGAVIDADDADMAVRGTAGAVEIVERRDTGQREVAATPSELLKSPAAR